jgi:deoxycytidylate deaminase
MDKPLTPEGIPYPYIPEGRAIKYVPEGDQYMSEARAVRKGFSTESNHPTGAVVVLGGEIVGKGANQAAIGDKRLQDLHKRGLCVRKILGIPSGQRYWLCPGCAKFKHHAEARAVRDALSKKASIEGADLYLYGHWWCCKPCWDAMAAAGIRDVYLVDGAGALFKR